MLVKTKAIVLHSFKYGESKLIIDLLTAGYGRQACIATVGKSPKGKLKKQYFQPLFILEVILDMRQRVRLQHIKEARVDVPFSSIPFSPSKLSLSMFTAEFLRYATKQEQADELTYAYVENSIRWLDECDGHFANFHLVFMMRLSKFLGFYPNLEDFSPGSRFDLRASCFRTDVPLHNDYLPPEEAEKDEPAVKDELSDDASLQDDARGTQPHGRRHTALLPDTHTRFSRTKVATDT